MLCPLETTSSLSVQDGDTGSSYFIAMGYSIYMKNSQLFLAASVNDCVHSTVSIWGAHLAAVLLLCVFKIICGHFPCLIHHSYCTVTAAQHYIIGTSVFLLKLFYWTASFEHSNM